MNARRRRSRGGFTLVEMCLSGFLIALLAFLLGNAWATFGRPAISSVARGRLAQEANLAAEALAHDVGLLALPNATPADSRYQNVQVLDQNAQGQGSSLQLTIDDATTPPRTITYAADPDDPTKLVRTERVGTDGPVTKRVVATLLANNLPDDPSFHGFQAERGIFTNPDSSIVNGVEIVYDVKSVHGVRIDMTFTHRTYDRDLDGTFRADHTRRYTLFVPDPSP